MIQKTDTHKLYNPDIIFMVVVHTKEQTAVSAFSSRLKAAAYFQKRMLDSMYSHHVNTDYHGATKKFCIQMGMYHASETDFIQLYEARLDVPAE